MFFILAALLQREGVLTSGLHFLLSQRGEEMKHENIICNKHEAHWTLVLNRPDKLNSFNQQMGEEFLDLLAQAKEDGSVRALLVTGAGRGFCVGQDLAEVTEQGLAMQFDSSQSPRIVLQHSPWQSNEVIQFALLWAFRPRQTCWHPGLCHFQNKCKHSVCFLI